MKTSKLLGALALGILIGGIAVCIWCRSHEKNNLIKGDLTNENRTISHQLEKGKIAVPTSASEYHKWVSAHTLTITCDGTYYTTSEGRHNITLTTDFDNFVKKYWGATKPVYDSVPWTGASPEGIVEKLRNNRVSCYDGYLKVDMINDKVTFSRFSGWDNEHSLYSEALFQGIAKKIIAQQNTNPIMVVFTKALIPVKRDDVIINEEKIIFKVGYLDGHGKEHYYFYDMSDDPV